MTRPSLIRAVYLELRQATGGSVPSGDLLEYAGQLVEAFTEVDEPNFDLRAGGPSFDECCLDTVFADGGWRVLERYSVRTFEDEDSAVNDPLIFRELETLGLEMCA